VSRELDNAAFLADLRQEIEHHPAVNHVFLSRIACTPFTKEDYAIFGLQHYPLVGLFCTYMEHLLLHAPDSDAKGWIAKVLVDEYGERSDGKDHAELYREFLHGCGVPPGEEDTVPLDGRVIDFIRTHMRLVTREHFLVGLGALGPGHEWAIPRMFELIIEGLRRAGFAEHEITYFTEHVEQDQDHGVWLEEALGIMIDGREDQELVRRGAMLSLEARARFWEGVQTQVVSWRQPEGLRDLRRKARKWVGDTQELLPWLPARVLNHTAIYRTQIRKAALEG